MSGDFISSGIKGILENGIDLKLESEDEEIYYTSLMCEYFNEESDFKAYLSGDRRFEVELNRSTPIMEITIVRSVLTIMPYTDDIFEAFAVMLAFIAKKHQQIVTDLRGEEIFKIEKLEEINKPPAQEQEATEEDSDDSNDDYEWI
tara:strand:+ start:782 stop:1219 length:438 start_codon:yes stop_codon:yes gene_type:complete